MSETKLTDTEARFLLAWHVRKDVPRNADGSIYKIPNVGRIVDSLISKEMFQSGRWSLCLTSAGIQWCEEHHLQYTF